MTSLGFLLLYCLADPIISNGLSTINHIGCNRTITFLHKPTVMVVGEELIVTVKLTVLSQPIELVSVKEIVYKIYPLQF